VALLVGEQLVPASAAALELADQVGDRRVHHRLDAALAVLGRVVEDHHVALDDHVRLAHGGQAVALVAHRVLLGADAEEAAVEQPHRRGQHAGAVGCLRGGEIGLHPPAQRGQRVRELDHVLELLQVALAAPFVVVAVLLAPGGVGAGGLQVAERVGADPHVLPGRRDAERADPGEHVGVGHPAAVAVAVLEALPALAPGDPGA
jgi:hypothetical protein